MRIYGKNAVIFKEMISAKFLRGDVLLEGKLQRGAKSSNFDIFESALYMKSLSMPLSSCKIGGLVVLSQILGDKFQRGTSSGSKSLMAWLLGFAESSLCFGFGILGRVTLCN